MPIHSHFVLFPPPPDPKFSIARLAAAALKRRSQCCALAVSELRTKENKAWGRHRYTCSNLIQRKSLTEIFLEGDKIFGEELCSGKWGGVDDSGMVTAFGGFRDRLRHRAYDRKVRK